MNGKYNQPTAHMLQPVKGWDSMAHLDFVAPIASKVKDALPGTVMHLNSLGELEVGLTPQGMGMYLFYKMWDEDVQPYPLTADGTRMTAVGMQSFGGYNSEVYLRGMEGNPYDTNGHASNVGAYQFDTSEGQTPYAKVKASQAAHTTYPAVCGMELSSTEFAATTDTNSIITYYPNDTLTAPLPDANVVPGTSTLNGKPGTQVQQAAGGFLKKGVCYKDPICGIVSKKPVINEHGYKQICFWSTWLPALSKDAPQAGATIKVGTAGDLFWDAGGSDSTTIASLFNILASTDGVSYATAADATYTPGETVEFVKWEVTNVGADAGIVNEDAEATITVGGTALAPGGDAVGDVTAEMSATNIVKLTFGASATANVVVTLSYAGKTSTVTFTKAA